MAEIAKFSPSEVKAYEDSLKSYRDLKNSLDTAREEAKAEGIKEGIQQGIQQGLEKGKTEEKRQTVLKSHQAGLAVDMIAAITDLPQAVVQSIIDEAKQQ